MRERFEIRNHQVRVEWRNCCSARSLSLRDRTSSQTQRGARTPIIIKAKDDVTVHIGVRTRLVQNRTFRSNERGTRCSADFKRCRHI